MSSLCQGVGLFGTGSTGGVVAELVSLGAADVYLVKGASVTFFRFRYARHTNFAMEAVGQTFQSQPTFGGHSQIILNRAGDLIYYMYVVVDLPGIVACRGGDALAAAACNSCSFGNQFPSYQNKSCKPCDCSDQAAYTAYGYSHTGATTEDQALVQGKAAWLRNKYGDCCGVGDDATECCSLPADTEKPWAHWVNAIGQFLIKRAYLVVGGHQVDVLYSDYLYMWEELSGKAGKRLREMIGKRKSRRQLIRDSKENRRLYIPLPWWFTQTSGNALPLCTLQFHGVQVHVEWEQLHRCIVTSHDDVQVYKCKDGSKITQNDLSAWLDTTFIYLDVEERNRFSLANFDQLITQVQFTSTTTNNGNQVTIPIPFNHPVIELIWAVRRKCNELSNNWFNYSGIDGRDPINEVNLRLNNLFRFSGREGRYYRLVQPYQHHSSIPKAHIYCYSFALYPEEPQPSGSCNFSRIDNVDMTFCLQEGLGRESVSILVFARNFNILRSALRPFSPRKYFFYLFFYFYLFYS